MPGNSLHDCTGHLWVRRHTEVVVAAPNRDLLLAPGELPGCREVGGVPGDLLEHPVGVVHLLLLDLLLEEALVVEAILSSTSSTVAATCLTGLRPELWVWRAAPPIGHFDTPWEAPSWQRAGSLARGPGAARVWLAPWLTTGQCSPYVFSSLLE